MKSLKRIILATLCIWAFSLMFSASFSQEFFYDQVSTTSDNIEDQLDIAKTIKSDSLDESNSILWNITTLLNINTYKDEARPALAYVQMLINLVLGLVSFVALIMVIFAFYQILFNKGEEGVTKAKKILSWVGIALLVMWLSWIIVSSFLLFFSTQTNTNLWLLNSNITNVI